MLERIEPSALNEWIFNNVPLYNKFRTPSMALVLANVCMAILATLTLKTVLDKERDRKAINRGLYIATGIIGGLILGQSIFFFDWFEELLDL